jgi:hypothetical protein
MASSRHLMRHCNLDHLGDKTAHFIAHALWRSCVDLLDIWTAKKIGARWRLPTEEQTANEAGNHTNPAITPHHHIMLHRYLRPMVILRSVI